MPESTPNQTGATTGIADAGTPKSIAKETTATETAEEIKSGSETTPQTTPQRAETTEPKATQPATPSAQDLATPFGKTIDQLLSEARASGMDENSIQEGLQAMRDGYLDIGGAKRWLQRNINPQGAVDDATNAASGEQTVDGKDSAAETSPTSTAESETAGFDEAQSEYEKTMSDLKDTYQESQDVLTAAAEERYNLEIKNLEDAQALQEELAAKQAALIASATEIQKQEAKNAYDANLAAIELQKKRVAEAYEEMKQEQQLLNTQRKVREETSIGLIYGGFGSVAANKNLEETIIRGERELMSISTEAINKDTELQNEVVNLNKAYELDVRKIEQWKAEQTAEVYAQLAGYVQEVTADKNMAGAEKSQAIAEAVADYNEKVAGISAAVAESRMNLSLQLINRADDLKQQEFNNQIIAAEEARAAEAFEYEKNRLEINTAREDLDLLMTTYINDEYDQLPPDVLAKMTELEKAADLPEGAAAAMMEAVKTNEAKAGEIVREYVNSVTGEVTAVRYNFDTGKVETLKLGALEEENPQSVWTKAGTDEDGNIILLNEATGEVRVQGQYGGDSGTPDDALSVPDGSWGGQCGHFVNQYTGIGVGDSYQSKLDKMDSSITTPAAGMVFVMPIQGSENGHIGFIKSTYDSDGDGKDDMATVKDSNWKSTSNPEVVMTHDIPIAQMTGFLDVGVGEEASSSEGTKTEDAAASDSSEEDAEEEKDETTGNDLWF